MFVPKTNVTVGWWERDILLFSSRFRVSTFKHFTQDVRIVWGLGRTTGRGGELIGTVGSFGITERYLGQNREPFWVGTLTFLFGLVVLLVSSLLQFSRLHETTGVSSLNIKSEFETENGSTALNVSGNHS